MGIKKILIYIIREVRIAFYKLLSDKKISCRYIQPVLFVGDGNIEIDETVIFGVERSPGFFSGYTYVDVRNKQAEIKIKRRCVINNNATIISDGCSIQIDEECLIGSNFQVIDSDFHGLSKESRRGNKNVKKSNVFIGANVLIGNNVTVLKGVKIGENSVIANGSVVSRSLPSNAICGGNPAKVIRAL
ncbi:acyltransferase [Shewanella mangrovisoli]|uniref:acyltransferase n=1 Tax=Shewanella mangrovisoli TaxID=2864211 RepID=UPI0035B8C471